MRTVIAGWAVWLGMSACAVAATPDEQSCRLLAVIGGNKVDEIEAAVTELAGKWTDTNRAGAVTSLKGLMAPAPFAGGSVYRIARLGDDLEEHLIILRLKEGEIAGMRMLYEWSPDGLVLTTMDFKRRYPDIIGTQILATPERIACP